MNYQEFLKYVEEHLADEMNAHEREQKVKQGESTESICYEARIHQITKNNGIVLDGVTLLNKGENAGPNIYLNNFYESYQMGKPLNVILQEIIECHVEAKEQLAITVGDVLNFEEVKEKIVLRLVNYDMNKEQLKDCPHKQFMDLAITFRYLAEKTDSGLASSLIFNKELEIWGVELDELYSIALSNTIREFPCKTESLLKAFTDNFMERLPKHLQEDFLRDVQELEEIGGRIHMHILSNDVGLNGATCLLYDGVLKQFADEHDCNLFVLPSSVHETILVLDKDDAEPESLKELVIEANKDAVGLIDLLSNNIYYYDREKDEITICQ